MKPRLFAAAALTAPILPATPVYAASGDPVIIGESLVVDPMIDNKRTINADALTLRTRAGAAFKSDSLALLVDGEGKLAIVNKYNQLPFLLAGNWPRARYSDVTDPMRVALNRLQLQYRRDSATVTLGRQYIDLDEQRSDDWGEHAQAFDAIRAVANVGPVSLDSIYSIRSRAIFGIAAGTHQRFEGSFFFAGAGSRAGPVNIKAFAYLLDYDQDFISHGIAAESSSQTYGARASSGFLLTPSVKINFAGSYARQSGYGGAQPFDHDVDHVAGEVGASVSDFAISAGYEKLGSHEIVAPGQGTFFSRFNVSSQTPMAALHSFNGRRDVFASAPPQGLRDYYAGVSYDFRRLNLLPGLNASLTYHKSESDQRDIDYGSALDASLGFRLSRFAILARYAKLDGSDQTPDFTADTRKFQLQIKLAY